MGRYIYRIHEPATATTYTCKHEPDGWGSYGVTFGRETNISNVVKGYVSSWKFVKEDAGWLKDRLISKGPNNRLRLTVLDTMRNMRTSEVMVYEGDIDMTQAQFDAFTFSAPTSAGGFFKALENGWDKEFEIDFDRYVKLTGAVFSDVLDMSKLAASYMLFQGVANTYRRACFIIPMNRNTEDVLSDDYTRNEDMRMIALQSTAEGSVVQPGVTCSVLDEEWAFMYCPIRTFNSLRLKYDIEFSCTFSDIDHYSNNDFNAIHRLELYGLPKGRFSIDSPVRPYLYYQLNRMDDEPDRQFYKLIDTVENTVRPQNNSVYGHHVTHHISLNSEVTIDDLDTGDENGMDFFLVLNVDIGHREGWVLDGGILVKKMIYLESISGHGVNMTISKNDLEVEYNMQLNVDKIIRGIKSSNVFAGLLSRISEQRYNVLVDTTSIEEKWNGDTLTGSLGMRQYRRSHSESYSMYGKITTTLGDFLKYVYAVYGYQLGVNYSNGQYTVFLAPFADMYNPASVIGDIDTYSDLSFTVSRDYLYSTIRVGYQSDNEVFNGELEYNNEQTWTTPNMEIEGSELDLVCPYNASSKAIETYLFKNYRNYENKPEDDGKVYLLETKYEEMSYDAYPMHVLKRSETIVSGIDFPETQWNVKFTPKRMLDAHMVELNSCFALDEGKQITRETCDLNGDLVSADTRAARVPYIVESAPIKITDDRVFIPITVSFKAKAGQDWIEKIESKRLGTIRIQYKGEIIAGYLAPGEASVTINPIHTSESEFTLLLTEKTQL